MKNKTTKPSWNHFEFDVGSRYGDIRTIKPVDIERGIFKVMGKSHFARGGEGMFDFEGGPMFMVGELFYNLGEIAAIDPTPSEHNGYAAVLVSVNYNKVSAAAAAQHIANTTKTST